VWPHGWPKQDRARRRREAVVRKQVSPVFALIVVLVAVVLGAIWFMARERKFQDDWQRPSKALQQQRDMAIRSGRARSGRMRSSQRGSRQPGASEQGAPAETSADEPEGAAEAP
jgi:hypothetical protein